jgi:hypothetical protein
MNEKKTENTNVEVQANLKINRANTEKSSDLWLGIGLFSILNLMEVHILHNEFGLYS